MLKFKTLKWKILTSFFSIIIGLTLVLIFNNIQTSKSNENVEKIINTELQTLTSDSYLAQTISTRIAAARGYVLTGDASYKQLFEESNAVSEKHEAILKELVNSDEINFYTAAANEWEALVQSNVFRIYDEGKKELAIQNLVAMDKQATEIRVGFEQLYEKRIQKINAFGTNTINENETAQRNGTLFTAICIILAVTVSIIVARNISTPIKKITLRIHDIANGNLTAPLANSKAIDEIGQLSNSTDLLLKKMNVVLKDIQLIANNVASHSEELTQSSHEVKLGTDQISHTVAEIATGTEQQAHDTTNVAHLMTDFTMKITGVNNEYNTIITQSNDVMALTNNGRTLMTSSTEQMHTIDDIMKNAVSNVSELSAQTKEISSIVTVIHDIASQTNLLSLNAAIEAARAGEHGKGFAVVADEVRKLSEQVASSVNHITQIVNTILERSHTVELSLQTGYEEVVKGTAQIVTTNTTFEEIERALASTMDTITSMSKELTEVVSSTKSMHNALDNIASIAQQSAASIEETSAVVLQAASSMDEIANGSDHLATMAEQLNGQVQTFKLFNN